MDKRNQTPYIYADVTDVGCSRELNEDSLFCGPNLWIVADGMGGHACGEVASQLAVKTIAEDFAITGQLEGPILKAHQKIIKAGDMGVGQAGMGTTVVVLHCSEQDYKIAWVGDSRAYLWDAKRSKLTQLTEDHSLIARLINSGLITAEDALNHPQRHMITQCLGSLEIDTPQVDTYMGRWGQHQQILLCSDGLSDEVSDEEIAAMLEQDATNEEKLASLVAVAKQKGGRDNISLILVDSPVVEGLSFWAKLKSLFSR